MRKANQNWLLSVWNLLSRCLRTTESLTIRAPFWKRSYCVRYMNVLVIRTCAAFLWEMLRKKFVTLCCCNQILYFVCSHASEYTRCCRMNRTEEDGDASVETRYARIVGRVTVVKKCNVWLIRKTSTWGGLVPRDLLICEKNRNAAQWVIYVYKLLWTLGEGGAIPGFDCASVTCEKWKRAKCMGLRDICEINALC